MYVLVMNHADELVSILGRYRTLQLARRALYRRMKSAGSGWWLYDIHEIGTVL